MDGLAGIQPQSSRCWAHLLKEAEDGAAEYDEGAPIYQYLEHMFVGLQAWLETDPTDRERLLASCGPERPRNV